MTPRYDISKVEDGGPKLKDHGASMCCKSCGSANQKNFSAEMAIHFLELKNIDRPVVWVFPEVVVCLDCGTAKFVVPKEDLRQLEKRDAAAAG